MRITMKIINKETREVLATIVGGDHLTLEGACDLMGIKLMMTADDYQNENGVDPETLELAID